MNIPTQIHTPTLPVRGTGLHVPIGEIARLRLQVRYEEYAGKWEDDWDWGGCSVVSELLEDIYGWTRTGGCYLAADGCHIGHFWNILPDGRILDATADQFLDGDNVRITEADDQRYAGWCDCDGHGFWPPVPPPGRQAH